jgi:hypothetical protein
LELEPIEVEILYKVNIEVQGKGKGYAMAVEVQPTDSLDILRSKVHFFKLFWQRKLQLVEKTDGGKVLKDLNQTFRDYGIKNNDTLVLRDAPRGNNGDAAEEL